MQGKHVRRERRVATLHDVEEIGVVAKNLIEDFLEDQILAVALLKLCVNVLFDLFELAHPLVFELL